MAAKKHDFESSEGAKSIPVEEKYSREVLQQLKERTPAAYQEHPEFGKIPHNTQCDNCIELIHKREENKRVFIGVNDPSRKLIQKSIKALHYEDDQGNWRTLNRKLLPHAKKKGIFHAPHQKLGTAFNRSSGYTSIELINGQDFRYNGELQLYYKEAGEEKALGKLRDQNTRVGSDGVKTLEAWDHIDRIQKFKEAGVKTDFLIKERPDYLKDDGELIFEDRIDLPSGYRILPDQRYGKRTGDGWWKGNLVVVDGANDTVLQWRAISIMDEKLGKDRSFVTGDYQVSQEGSAWTIRMRMKMEEVKKKGLQFPLIVDPLVSGSNTYSSGMMAYKYSNDPGTTECWDDGYCSYTMTVNVPGMSEITDAYFDMEYEAVCDASACYIKDDGGFDLHGPCGRVPDDPDPLVKFTCQDGNPGTCSGSNTPAFPTVDCVSPQCSDHNINFEMRTYNCHNDALTTECSGQSTAPTTHLFTANDAWVMTVEARTVESTGPISSSSGTTICEGQSTDLSVGADYGVSPYTYTWSPGGMTGTPVTVSPTSTTTYDVDITDDCGNTTTESITINVDPEPTVDAGNDTTICEGDDAFLNGSYGGSASSITWSTSGDGSFSSSTDPNATYTPGANDISNGSVTLTITTDDPSGPCTSVSDDMTLTIEPAPTVSAGSDATICEGDDHTLSGSFGGSATGLDWTTSGDGSFSSSTDPNATYTPGANDISNGSVTLTATSTGGCKTVSDDMTLTIDPEATADAGADASICKGDDYTLNGNFGGSASSITWSTSGDGSFNNASDPNAVYTPGSNDISNGSVTLTITTDDPSGPCGPASDDMTLTIDPLPTVSFSGLNSPYCYDADEDTLTGNEAPNGSFSGTAGVTDIGSGEGTFDPSSAGPGTYEVYYSYTDGNGCTNVDTQSVTVDPPPTVGFTGLNGPYCDNVGGDTLLGDQAPDGSFSGTAGVTDLGSGEGYFDPIAAGTGTHEVYYTYTDGNGCTNTDTQTVDVLESPTLDSSNITITDATCGNSDGAIEDIVVNGGTSPYSPEWRDASNTVVGNSMDLTGVPSGDYTITVSDANGCTDTLGPIPVSDIGAPTVDAGPDTTICEGDSAEIGGSPTATGGTSPYAYSWDNAGTLDDDSIANPNASPASTTTYTVTVTDDNNCSATDNMTLTVDPAPTVDAGADSSICADDTATLNGSFGGGASSVSWSTLGDGGFANANDPNTTYVPGSNDISAGSVTLVLTTDTPSGPCAEAADSMELDILQLPNTNPSDELICKGDSASIGVDTGSSHVWNTGAISDSITVSPDNDSNYWVATTGANGCTVTDTILVEVDTPKTVVANDDTLEVDAGSSGDLDVTVNDSGSPFLISESELPDDGDLDGPLNGFFTYTSHGNAEEDSFSYWICDLACGNSCDTATVHIIIDHEEEEEFFIPNGISVDGDGINDEFRISGLDEYPDNSLTIFNRWGDEVFYAEPYENDWKGESSNGEVTEGTYYYVLDLGPDEEKKTGFIELRR